MDGGAFPFVAPVSPATWPLPYPLAVVLAAGAVLCFFGAVRNWNELKRPVPAALFVGIAIGLAVLLALGGPDLVQTGGV